MGQNTIKPLILVACSKKKLDHPARAKELYCSTWFKLARAYAERWAELSGGKWYILSAKHGIVHPDNILEPYDFALADMPYDERMSWAWWISWGLRLLMKEQDLSIVVGIGGVRYFEYVTGVGGIILPLAGMGIGKQLAFMKKAAQGGAT